MRIDRMRLLTGLILLLAHAAVQAGQCEDYSLPVNAGFELPLVSSSAPPAVETYAGVKLYLQSNVPGWRTLSPAGLIEFWQSGISGVAAYEGNQFAEVQAASMHSMYQDVNSVPGSTIRWSFAHRGREGNDTLEVRLGSTTSTVVQQTVTTGTTWRVISGTYVVPAGQGTTRFELRPTASQPSGGSVGNLVDAVKLQVDCDYGDAASTYGVLATNNGPAHIVTTARLGAQIDREADGVPGASVNADDLTGVDDEDGLPDGTAWNLGAGNVLAVQASAAGFLNVWVDVARDGIFQATDRIFTDTPVVAGNNSLPFTLPSAGSPGNTTVRIRYSTSNPGGTLGPLGFWPNGEVEDHLVALNQSLRMEWRFDEFEWTGVNGEVLNSGTAVGAHGTASGGATTGQAQPALTGASGTCSFGRFDGVDDRVLLGSLGALNVPHPPNRLTMSAWIRPRLISAAEQLVIVRGLAGSGSTSLELALFTRAGRYELRQRRGSSTTTIGAAAPVGDLNSWVHLAAVYDGTSWRLYRNGAQIAASGNTNGPPASASALWAVGARHPSNTGAASPFRGDIDEVNLWQQAMTAAEVAQLPLLRHPCPQANLTVMKSVLAEADLHDAVNAKLVPASTAIYTINVTNSGSGGTDEGTLTINDTLPADVELWSGNFAGGGSPVQFVDGAPASGLSMQFAGLADTVDDVVFLDAAGVPMVPNGSWDPAVRTLRVEFDERMRPAGRSFSLRFRVRLK